MASPAPAAQELPAFGRGACLGRYVILRRIGSGGMGVVYEAYDPELSRRIALKLVAIHPRSGQTQNDHRERLLREAQALAQLSHPNVITVYDVGTIEGHVFIAMELVAGRTLRIWRRELRPSRAQVVQVFLAAGRALAAAHAAHLIHRDFKPDNVLIGNDGRVRVVDFGLARTTETSGHPAPAVREDDDTTTEQRAASDQDQEERTAPRDLFESSELLLDSPLTEVGRIMGTPRYMAPEQHLGLAVDEKSDQFSFCVALYEALYDQHPFPARDRATLISQVTQGRVTDRPEAKVPARLRRIVTRGMAVPPDERYPEMDSLLRELAADPWIVRRRIALAAGVLVLAATAVFGLLRQPSVVDPRCTGIADDLVGVWDPTIAASVREHFLATGRPHAQATYDRVAALLDQYTATWVDLNAASCEATRRGTQSEHMLDLRGRCFDDALAQTATLTTLLANTDEGELVDHAVTATLGLPEPADCRKDAALADTVAPPASAIERARVDGLRQRLNRVTVLANAGQVKPALAEATILVDEVRSLGYGPLLSQSLFRLASIQRDAGDMVTAEANLGEALLQAARVGGDATVARIWVDLVGMVGFDQTRFAEGLILARAAEVAIARAGSDPLIEATLQGTLGSIYWTKGDYPLARLHHEQAIAIREESQPDHPNLAISYNNYGNVLWDEKKYDEAERYYRRALAIWERALGPEHPDVATALTNLGNVLTAQGELDQAVAFYRRALQLKRAALGPDNPSVATSLTNIGEALKTLGRLDEALDYQYQALAIWRMSHGDNYPYVAVAYNNIAAIYRQRKDCTQAIENYQKAVDIFSATLGPEHLYVAHPLHGLGVCYLDRGQLDQAIPLLERAHQIRRERDNDPLARAETGFTLGRALWAAGRDQRRALALAREAQAAYAAAGDEAREDRAEVDAWLAQRSRPR